MMWTLFGAAFRQGKAACRVIVVALIELGMSVPISETLYAYALNQNASASILTSLLEQVGVP